MVRTGRRWLHQCVASWTVILAGERSFRRQSAADNIVDLLQPLTHNNSWLRQPGNVERERDQQQQARQGTGCYKAGFDLCGI